MRVPDYRALKSVIIKNCEDLSVPFTLDFKVKYPILENEVEKEFGLVPIPVMKFSEKIMDMDVFVLSEYLKGQNLTWLDVNKQYMIISFISKEDMDSYLDDTMGNFVGIGIYMIKNTQYDKIQVLSTIKGGPAEKVGIQAGDLIVSVDGVEYKADDMTTASNNIKGEEGTKVTVEILRGTETIKYDLTREKVIVNQVEGKVISNGIGYIKFTSFDETTA